MRTYSVNISAQESAEIYRDARQFAGLARDAVGKIESYLQTREGVPDAQELQHIRGLLLVSKDMMEYVTKLMVGVRKLQGRPHPKRLAGAHKIEA